MFPEINQEILKQLDEIADAVRQELYADSLWVELTKHKVVFNADGVIVTIYIMDFDGKTSTERINLIVDRFRQNEK